MQPQIDIDTLITLGGVVVTAITVIVSVRFALRGIQADLDAIKKTNDIQSADITDLKIRVARQEEKTNVLEEMRTQIKEIWQHIMRSSK